MLGLKGEHGLCSPPRAGGRSLPVPLLFLGHCRAVCERRNSVRRFQSLQRGVDACGSSRRWPGKGRGLSSLAGSWSGRLLMQRRWGGGLAGQCSMGPQLSCLPLRAHSPQPSQLSLCLQPPPEKAELTWEAAARALRSHTCQHQQSWARGTLTRPRRWSAESCASSRAGTPPGRSAAAPGLS